MKYRAVLFDLDNTLTHRPETIRGFAPVFAAHFRTALVDGLSLDALAADLVAADGHGYAGQRLRGERIQALSIWKQVPEYSVINDYWKSWIPVNSIPMDGAHWTLEQLQASGTQLGVITNGSMQGQATKIKEMDFERFFSCVTISESAGKKKPDPEIFLETLATMSVEPNRAVFVGDHPVNDCGGAMAAGIASMWLRGFEEWPAEQADPDWVIDELAQIPGLLDA